MFYRNNLDGTRDYKLKGKASCMRCHGYGTCERCVLCNGAGVVRSQKCAGCMGNGVCPPGSQVEAYDPRNEF